MTIVGAITTVSSLISLCPLMFTFPRRLSSRYSMSSPTSYAAAVVALGAAPIAQADGALVPVVASAMEGDEEPYIIQITLPFH